jgi:hypothetical protein
MHAIPPNPDDPLWHAAQRCNCGNCVRIATNGEQFFIRDSKSPEGPVLMYTKSEWVSFIEGVRQGDFDDLI